MEPIDQALFNFSPRAGLAVAVMVGFLVFAVALDLTRGQFRRVLKSPRAPGVGLLAQYLILPAAAFGIGMLMASTPSIALGLLLVACCPAGALSNYLTGVARGSVATSVSMTAISTLFSIVVTPFLFAFWASMNPATSAVIARIEIDPQRVVMVLLIMLVVPVAAGMIIRARRPDTAEKIRLWVRRIAGLVFAVVVAVLLLGNISVLGSFAGIALPPVLVTFAIAVLLGWGLARASGLVAADRRAVTLEVAFQNVALAIGLAVAFFPDLAGVAITSILWGVVHLSAGFAIAAMWMRMPLPGNPQAAE
ncbi:bile acid:sodium symporter family protein [Nitratireductor mangrovi]|uniref:Bile acid:sodium symporter family protein n=1 Tax=Nitratireductor mangrovi TaxID=2599600 RepID=A0A5B8L0G7_9HYPH|nr:bile acid:sodium symporter family protein [Nitratireductor mangrovi]QDZ01339.1 bile acid:sodium symporter family protein [Nitratireductor mangrovi]